MIGASARDTSNTGTCECRTSTIRTRGIRNSLAFTFSMAYRYVRMSRAECRETGSFHILPPVTGSRSPLQGFTLIQIRSLRSGMNRNIRVATSGEACDGRTIRVSSRT